MIKMSDIRMDINKERLSHYHKIILKILDAIMLLSLRVDLLEQKIKNS